ncbi:MAG: tRNA pseudouridine(13) synthase TruD [Planctomycetota bacterium]
MQDDPPQGPASPTAAGIAATYRTAGVTPVGGVIKQRPEDFLVEELPLYAPTGEGEHLMMLVEKRDMSTLQMARVLANHFGVRPRDVGYAGLKDKRAITRQHATVHVPGRRPEDFPSLRHDRVTILWIDRHASKIRRGHLEGNGFSIRIRQTQMQHALHAHKALAILARRGAANAFGPQRFGTLGANHLVGRALVTGDLQAACDLLLGPVEGHEPDESRTLYAQGNLRDALHALPASADGERRVLNALAQGSPPPRAIWSLGKTELAFLCSALQSWVFNAVLRRRLAEGSLDTLREGDVAAVHAARQTTFVADADELAKPELEARLDRVEVSPTGPMWGPAMRRATGATGEMERAALHDAGITLEQLDAFAARNPRLIDGARRPLRVPLRNPDAEGGADEHGVYVRCAFELPRGAFATEVIREIIKPEPDPSP